MKATAAYLTAMLAGVMSLSAPAGAQELTTSLPLTSVGDRLNWTVGDQQLVLDVPVAGPVSLDLYSPRLDPADYRADSYYGDERYDQQAVSTTFTVLDAQGKLVLTRTFGLGDQRWESLIDQALPAGRYTLSAVTSGNGKNTFALRLGGVSARVQADRLSVNVHSQAWVPVVNVSTDGSGDVLRLYDGDGPQELEARLRLLDGTTQPLPVSGQLAWTDLPLPRLAGSYVVELRQLPGARQYSNTVGFALAGRPLTLIQRDTTGTLAISAELLLPGAAVPTQVQVTVGGQTLGVNGSYRAPVKAGTYPVSVSPVPGAAVRVAEAQVSVPSGGTGAARVTVQPQVRLTLRSDRPEVCLGDLVTLEAQASSDYRGRLPGELSLELPAGLEAVGEPLRGGELGSEQPATLRVQARAVATGPLSVQARLSAWAQIQSASLSVRPDATQVELTRAALAPARLGDTVTLSVTARNTAAQPVTFTLSDELPAGLEALDPVRLTGTLAPGETRTLTYRARVTGLGSGQALATLTSSGCAVSQTSSAEWTVLAPPTPGPAPVIRRQSTVHLPFDAPVQARTLVVAQALPEGAAYVLGSSRLNGQLLPDPLRGASGSLYWTLPVQAGGLTSSAGAGLINYDLAHSAELPALPAPALYADYGRERREVLKGAFDARDYQGAARLQAEAEAEAGANRENSGAVRLPLSGAVFRDRDKVTVTVEGPLGSDLTPTINGAPISSRLIGTVTTDSATGLQRLEYYGVPLRVGPNELRLGSSAVTVTYAGALARVELTPVQAVADGSSPVRVRVRALDAAGVGVGQSFLTVGSTLEFSAPDANPAEAGYQIRLTDGEGEIVLAPQGSPVTAHLNFQVGLTTVARSFEVRAGEGTVGAALLSATLGFPDGFSVSRHTLDVQARGYLETNVAGGKLYAAADSAGLPGTSNPLLRYPVHGDASTESVPLQGQDPLALEYDHPAFRAAYRLGSVPLDVLPVGERLTAASVVTRSNPVLSGFVAAVNEDRESELIVPDGTRIVRLRLGHVVPDSETLQLQVRGAGGAVQGDAVLQRNIDYTIDPDTGVVVLTQALDRIASGLYPQGAALSDLVIRATYRLENGAANRKLAYGVQAKYVGVLTQGSYSLGAAVVSLDGQLTSGVRATLDTPTLRADLRGAYAGGVQFQADVQAASAATLDGSPRASGSFQARYQSADYAGLQPFSSGLSLTGSATARLAPRLALIGNADYHSQESAEGSVSGGSLSARAEYQLAPFSLGAGLKYGFGDQRGLGAVLATGYHQGKVDLDVVHTQPLTGELDTSTEVTGRYALTPTLRFGVHGGYNWTTRSQTTAVTLAQTLGNTSYEISYDLPTASGQGNRARLGVSTTLPLGQKLSLGLHAAASRSFMAATNDASAGADLRYQGAGYLATLGSDVAYTGGKFGVALRAGVTGSLSDHLTVTADALAQLGEQQGLWASLGYSYRNAAFSSLGYLRYQNGSLAGSVPETSFGLSGEYRQPRYAVRAGLEGRALLSDLDSLTYQPYVGGTVYVTDDFGLGGWGRALLQPASETVQYGYGLEASLRALPGTWISAGYNFRGFEGNSGASYSRPGAYLRLDVTLDEAMFGGNSNK